ncbi:MAG: helix-turn-helix domain-containing protein [Candidatus Pseudobacter hemicellulosilyticus]|uniref:Helix-turn-helix domain-containing protein n=1 Tax=Candidatus Pseudobacter hemicellulosilyticus TaxID=3121375 RepID=A0AAJ5WTK6_9BACT|nr:MAG: helix-turn-helix domain-containing protein [Pseudobacter sp.]
MAKKKKIRMVSMDQDHAGISIARMSGELDSDRISEAVITPHRHDHYTCFLIERGTVDFALDFQPMRIDTTVLGVSCPGQVHQFLGAAGAEGWIFFFEPKWMHAQAREAIEERMGPAPMVAIDKATHDWFVQLFGLIAAALEENRTGNYLYPLTKALVDAFAFRVAGLIRHQEDEQIRQFSSRSVSITRKFRQLLNKNFLSVRKPSEYAALMNISSSHLNDTIKAVTGLPVTHFIQQELLAEAQRLLYYTDRSVKEVADQLGFEDHKYFSRFFGKLAGMSPVAFRKLHREGR